MNIQELIKHLERFPPETKVVVSGYENGFNDITEIKSVSVGINENAKWYDGFYREDELKDRVTAIAVLGNNKNDNE